MNVLRWVAAVAVVAALVGGGTAQEADNKAKIVGTWETVKATPGMLAAGMTLEFTKEGKLVLSFMGMKQEGTYKVDGDKLSLTMFTPGRPDYHSEIPIKKLTDKELVLSDKRGEAELKKK